MKKLLATVPVLLALGLAAPAPSGAVADRRVLRDHGAASPALGARRLGLDGEPQLRADHRVAGRTLHQRHGHLLRARDQLPQHHPREPAELHRRRDGEPLADLLKFRFDCNPGTTCSSSAPSLFDQVAS